MSHYSGDRTIDGVEVTVDGKPLDPRLDIKKISPDGFEWSYEGDSPAQLALALLMEHLKDAQKAIAFHEEFMREIVANFNNEWEMNSEDIEVALQEIFGDSHRQKVN